MAATSPSEQSFRFLDLPPELRAKIYHILWSARLQETGDGCGDKAAGHVRFDCAEEKTSLESLWSHTPGSSLWPLTRSCSLVYRESLYWLYKDVPFAIQPSDQKGDISLYFKGFVDHVLAHCRVDYITRLSYAICCWSAGIDDFKTFLRKIDYGSKLTQLDVDIAYIELDTNDRYHGVHFETDEDEDDQVWLSAQEDDHSEAHLWHLLQSWAQLKIKVSVNIRVCSQGGDKEIRSLWQERFEQAETTRLAALQNSA